MSNAIGFLASASERNHYKYLFEKQETLKSICENVVVPNIEFRGKVFSKAYTAFKFIHYFIVIIIVVAVLAALLFFERKMICLPCMQFPLVAFCMTIN